jgi:predicted AAA+ superfamily ATPase
MLLPNTYLKRLADGQLSEHLEYAGAVLIRGPKGCGKTATAERLAKSSIHFDTDDEAALRLRLEPQEVLSQPKPILFDEWQEQPKVWNLIRRSVDATSQSGQFILTGSANPPDDTKIHSGVGRFDILQMRPLSSFERGWSTGEARLKDIMAASPVSSKPAAFDIHELIEHLIYGGWPGLLNANLKQAEMFNRNYIDMTSAIDISRVSNKRRDPLKVKNLLRSLARNISTPASYTTLSADASGAGLTLSDETVADYLEALERLMLYEPLLVWSTHIRSSATLRKGPKHYFTDPSLAIGALRLTEKGLLDDLNYLGLLFECYVIRDLRIYAQQLEGEVFYYRDSTGLEADAIIEFPDDKWIACEIKLDIGAADEAAANLNKLASVIDTDKKGKPSALLIITANGFAHRREDGVYVVPIGCLKP